MTASFLTVVSVCANVKMERVMHLHISSGFGFPIPFYPKADLKVRNQCHVLRGLELRSKSVLLPTSPLWNSHSCAGVQEKA